MPVITKKAHNSSFCRKQTDIIHVILSLSSQSTSSQKHAPLHILEHFLGHYWFSHSEEKRCFSPNSSLMQPGSVTIASAMLWGFPSKFSYSHLGQMGTSATANLLTHFTEIWKKLKQLVQSQHCRRCYPYFSFAGIHLCPPTQRNNTRALKGCEYTSSPGSASWSSTED